MLDDRNAEVDASVRDEIAKLAAFLRRSGAKVSLTARPAIDFDALMRVYIALLRAATSARITPRIPVGAPLAPRSRSSVVPSP
jgi:amidase